MNTLTLTLSLALSAGALSAQAAQLADFEDLALAPNSYFQPQDTVTFQSGPASFHHEYTEFFPGCCWNGWTYSNQTDTQTPGFGNEASAVTGGGVNGSAQYGVAFLGEARISFAAATLLEGAWFTNTTYTYRAVKDGVDGNDPPFVKGPFTAGDFLKLTIQGRDANDSVTATVDFLLADGSAVLDTWTWVDLAGLGAVHALSFLMESSDSGMFGMNTPAYFAMDDLTISAVPLPAPALLLASGALTLVARRRRAVA
ncbi:MAG TPA: DUF4465 domain-containing protein [Gammaproteobacteria bacterium]|nr:DUF4465 domain-containing protein [Gammaproteobacteria bacterium]